MLRTIIVEDEQKSQEVLSILLKDYCEDVNIIGIASNARDGRNIIEEKEPDLVILDIEMPYGSGFDLLTNLKYKNFDIIFTTAYDQYAIKAFKFSAIDYLLKPISIEEIKNAIRKVKERRKEKNSMSRINQFINNYRSSDKKNKKIAFSTSEGLTFSKVNEILRFEASGSYTTIFLKDGQKITVSKTMKEYEDLLEDHGFFRIHNSHIINLEYVKQYKKGNPATVILEDDTEIQISRGRKDAFVDILNKYWG